VVKQEADGTLVLRRLPAMVELLALVPEQPDEPH